MDWCVKAFDEANHPLRAVLDGYKSQQPYVIKTKAGKRISLDASGSTDPDAGESLYYEWRFFPEAGSYRGKV